MKKYLTLFTTGIILILSSCATNSDIDNLQSQIDGLKSGQIATIESQINSITGSITSLQEADREIKGYISVLQNTATELQKSINSADGKIDDLEKALVLVNTAIENLKAKDSALEQRITDLKDYVDTQLRGAKDWVSATFATLEQYNGIVSEIGGIKGSISSINTAMEQMESRLNGKITLMKGEIEEAYTKAIGALESSLKNWVNEQLEGYWTIAETEGKLEALRGILEKEDESIRGDIDKLRSSLDSAKTELTEGYKAAIKKAIEENNGVLDGKLSEAVSSLNTRIDGEVSTINERIDGIEERVASLEAQVTALVSRIQSLAYIPRYTDGASTMWRKIASDGSIEARDTLDFRVSPADCADELVKVWEKAVSAEAVSLFTRSSQVTAALPVVSVTGGDGKIGVVLDGSSLSEEFYAGEQQMRVVVIISDGNNERTSEYIPMLAKEIKSIIEVESVTINPQLADLVIGETLQLSATVLPSDASDKTVSWASSKQSVATVSNTGLVTAIAEGVSTITASAGGKTATCQLTVLSNKVSVSGVSLDKTSLTMTEGDTQALTATVTPSDATDKSVTWSSDNESVAMVSSTGVVIARSAGTAIITVKTTDGAKTATCAVTVTAKVISVTGVSLDKTSLMLTEGDTQTLTATVSPSNATDKSVTWSSSNTSVATVSSAGVVTARSAGTATITATAGEVSAECIVTVTVSDPPAGAVDLGIMMTRGDGTTYKLYWAKSNLSDKGLCTNPEDYGDYYAWGEIDPYYSSQDPLTWKGGKTGYNWASYKWCNGSYSTLTKYNTSSSYGNVDNKTVLESSDDVASVKLGGKWRMPTGAEWRELMTKCTWTWTTNYNGTGVTGRIVTATNGNSIFLPAAGGRLATDLNFVGSDGNYWSSSLSTDRPRYAWDVGFGSDNVYRLSSFRCYGFSVRPVSE